MGSRTGSQTERQETLVPGLTQAAVSLGNSQLQFSSKICISIRTVSFWKIWTCIWFPVIRSEILLSWFSRPANRSCELAFRNVNIYDVNICSAVYDKCLSPSWVLQWRTIFSSPSMSMFGKPWLGWASASDSCSQLTQVPFAVVFCCCCSSFAARIWRAGLSDCCFLVILSQFANPANHIYLY